MNTYTFSISTTSPDNEKTYSEINLFDQTNFTIDMTDVYSDVFPNYIAFNWGDNSPIEERATLGPCLALDLPGEKKVGVA